MTQPSGDTQRQRRFKYGLNVAVAIAAAVGLAVLANWIGYRHFIRIDRTATRRYSLSPQSRKVLKDLEGDRRIVTLFGGGNLYVNEARDLVDEYARHGRNVKVQHIVPARQPGQMEIFLGTLRDRYEDQLLPLEQTIRDSRSALHQVAQSVSAVRRPLQEILENPDLPNGELGLFVKSMAQAFARFGGDVDTVDRQISRIVQKPLPIYGRAKRTLENLLVDLRENVFTPSINRLNGEIEKGGTPPAIADRLLAIIRQLEQVRTEVNEAVSALQNAPDVQDYEKLVGQLDDQEVIVLVGPAQVRVIALGDMFREPDPNQIRPGEQPQLRFQGEEKITGALVSMNLSHRPMAVFVTSGQQQAIGPRGEFEHVAQRLRNLNFDVQQWSPVAQPGPMGQPMPPGPLPVPEEGQHAVWIVLPVGPINPMNPMTAGTGQQVADLLQERLEAGDAAMVMLTLSPMPMAGLGGADPVAQFVSSWGVTPQLDRLVLREVVLPDHQRRATSQLDITHWATQLPITRAIAGMPGVFVQANPLLLASGQDGSNQPDVWPLVEVSGRDLWTQTDLQSNPNPTLDPATAGGPFVIAAAAERDKKRLVVVADPVWASDQVTTMGPQGLPAQVFGAAFPGNTELFVNSVYWLAGLDQLIAASPRTQDIRRVGPMADPAQFRLKMLLLVGMPLSVMATGVFVWSVRRRN